MSCQDCNSSNISLTGSWFPGSPCVETDCGGATVSSLCVYYNGPALTCSGVDTLDSLEIALQKIDTQICAITGDYSTYTMNCLPTWWGSAITTQAEFVDAITSYACDINSRLVTFTGTTYPANQATLNAAIAAITSPGITCATASVTNTDTLTQVLNKYCTKMTALTTAISISGVVWNNCLTVVSTPTTIATAFQLVENQICTVYNLINEGGILPTFNNYESCIGGTSDDSLVETIGLIKTRLCNTPTINMDNIVWGCFTEVDTFEEVIVKLVSEIGTLISNSPTFFEDDFTITANDPMNPCAGYTVSLAVSPNQDRFVAVNASDSSPSTLVAKIVSGGTLSIAPNGGNTQLVMDVANGSYGNITVSGSGNVWTIPNDTVTYAKMQNMTTARLLGRTTAGSGDVEEIAAGSNITLAGGAINTYGRTLIGITTFSGSSTWTKPTGCNAVVVHIIGGGGGGGGVTGSGSNGAAGGGGGGGCYLACYITSGLSATHSVTIGAGGTAGSSAAGNGGTGGTSSFGALVVVTGGAGGTGMAFGTSIATAAGGLSGIVSTSTGTVIAGGQDAGDPGMRFSGTVAVGGCGGNGFHGGKSGQNTVTGAGLNSGAAGGGGSGAVSFDGSGYAGAIGTGGFCIVYEYS